QHLLDISIPGDRLFMTDAFVNTPFEQPAKGKPTVYFFLDRSIYRQGQTVYFKGIAIVPGSASGAGVAGGGGLAGGADPGDRQPKVLAGKSTKVALYNRNNEKVDELQLTTDEFGAYHGTFKLPEHQLNG